MFENIIKVFLILFLFSALGSCERFKMEDKDLLLLASRDFMDVTTSFRIYPDSSFLFIERFDKEKLVFKGDVVIQKDTLFFMNHVFPYNDGRTAVLKNGYIDFIDGRFPYRLKIEQSKVKYNNFIDYSQLKNLVVLQYPEFWDKTYKSIDLTTKEILEIQHEIKKMFDKNGLDYSKYITQIETVIDNQNHQLVLAGCYCDIDRWPGRYFNEITVMDGGVCNVGIELNLTTGTKFMGWPDPF